MSRAAPQIVNLRFAGRRETEVAADLARLLRECEPGRCTTSCVRPGVPCAQIDRTAREVITEAGYGDRFIHRTGHGGRRFNNTDHGLRIVE